MTASRAETRSVGVWLLLGADALFYGAMLFIYAIMRGKLDAWPDLPVYELPLTLPLLSVVATAAAAFLARARVPAALVFALIAAALLGVAALWLQARGHGLSLHTGRYGLCVFGFVALWTLHLVGALVAAGKGVVRGAREMPLLGRFLAAQAVAGLALVLAVFQW